MWWLPITCETADFLSLSSTCQDFRGSEFHLPLGKGDDPHGCKKNDRGCQSLEWRDPCSTTHSSFLSTFLSLILERERARKREGLLRHQDASFWLGLRQRYFPGVYLPYYTSRQVFLPHSWGSHGCKAVPKILSPVVSSAMLRRRTLTPCTPAPRLLLHR